MKTLKAASCISLTAGAAISTAAAALRLDRCDWIPNEAPALLILATLVLVWLLAGKLLT